ncbi:MAG: phosphoribosylformylglycinamidine cyclo-ligase, partial [Thermoleophilia bacterium]|nr:phosphoribosylformylglycinamidine cyclo-ligase [Thermoleophilia bacterium]
MTTYDAAGVSLATAGAVAERLRAAVDSTRTPAVVGSFGAFAGLYALDDDRLLAASSDGVGTKLVLAREAGRLRDAGRDLAAHCVNDVVTTGAEPLFFLDYVAAARLDLEDVAELVSGAADVCRDAGCAILGGETAEMPGVYREEELDFAGTCVGLVRRDRLVDGARVRDGDVVLGLPSSGLHANGYSLVRRLLADQTLDVELDGNLLLAPTRLYLDEVRRLREACDVRALAH